MQSEDYGPSAGEAYGSTTDDGPQTDKRGARSSRDDPVQLGFNLPYSAIDLPLASFTFSFHCDLISLTTDGGSEM